ncbi:hypothetical protein BSK64_06365 [Paenibacillus odorifer]|uniref:hypothetical protein n=1 Tax=Paenibacillus odorifer TaxID=189426 RepID=UPI00096E9EB2|nr:hypothetical protein [Paenibacillus odorifer]OME07875.1 hypothetical protein BSK64_06365 [Paenibacillus odorifer]
MPKVFVHVHDAGDIEFENDYHSFSRIPVENEYFTLSHDGDWYRVELIIHTPFDEEIEAEIYGVKVDHMEIMKDKLNPDPGFSFG